LGTRPQPKARAANGDTLRLVFSAYPAIDELYTEHELGMSSELHALPYIQHGHGNSRVDAEEDSSEAVLQPVVDIRVEVLLEVVPALDDDVVGGFSSVFGAYPPGCAAIALKVAQNQLFTELARLGDLRPRIQPLVEWKNLPTQKLKNVAPTSAGLRHRCEAD
jgi:hypothetical protein